MIAYASPKQKEHPYEREVSLSPKPEDEVAAILCSDLHLWGKAPLARSAESDWQEAMRRQLVELCEIATKYAAPVVCAGDVFDRWNPGPELVNFALAELPHLYAIPGQHDLPCHNYSDIRKTAFWTLVQADKITLLEPGRPVETGKRYPIRLWGFPFGCPVKPLKNPHDLLIEIIVIHSYVWTKKVGAYDGAPAESRLKNFGKKFKGYDVACIGDNHTHFSYKLDNGCLAYNCGTFFRRKMDERECKPSVGLLMADGSVERHFLDSSKDVFLDGGNGEIAKGLDGMRPFLDELSTLGDAAISFSEEIKRQLDRQETRPEVKELVLKWLGL